MLVGKDRVSYEPARRFVRKLPGICPVYYTNGNHEQRMKEEPEYYSDSYAEYKAALEQSGVHFLENESKVISAGGIYVELCALELPLDTYRKLRKSPVTPEEIAQLTEEQSENRNRNRSCHTAYCWLITRHIWMPTKPGAQT